MPEVTEICAHDVYVAPCEDTESVITVNGKGWEGEPFALYLNQEEASSLLVQLGYYVTGETK